MKANELRQLIREEVKKLITSKKKKSLNENFSWQRKPGKPLPTIAEVQAEYQKKKKLKEESDDTWYKDEMGGNDLDSSKGGTDNSMNKIHSSLVKVQKEMDKLFADFKSGVINKDIYVSKRKVLQTKRDKLEASLM
jgi:hypothetical protein